MAQTVVGIKIEGLAELEGRFRDAPGVVESEIKRAMNRSVQRVLADVKRETPVDTGRLRSSITGRTEGSGAEIRGIVGTNVKYAAYVEFGTRPHWPPIKALEVWARRHGTTAYQVALGIARHGTRAREMFRKGLESNVEWIKGEFEEVGERIARRLTGG